MAETTKIKNEADLYRALWIETLKQTRSLVMNATERKQISAQSAEILISFLESIREHINYVDTQLGRKSEPKHHV